MMVVMEAIIIMHSNICGIMKLLTKLVQFIELVVMIMELNVHLWSNAKIVCQTNLALYLMNTRYIMLMSLVKLMVNKI